MKSFCKYEAKIYDKLLGRIYIKVELEDNNYYLRIYRIIDNEIIHSKYYGHNLTLAKSDFIEQIKIGLL